MKRKQKTDYSMLIIMLPFCLMFEIGKLAFSVLGTIASAATKPKPKRYQETYIPEKIPKPKSEPKRKPIDYSKIEKYQSEIRKSKLLLEHYNDNLIWLTESFRNELYKSNPNEKKLVQINNQIAATQAKIETEESKTKQYRIKLKKIQE